MPDTTSLTAIRSVPRGATSLVSPGQDAEPETVVSTLELDTLAMRKVQNELLAREHSGRGRASTTRRWTEPPPGVRTLRNAVYRKVYRKVVNPTCVPETELEWQVDLAGGIEALRNIVDMREREAPAASPAAGRRQAVGR